MVWVTRPIYHPASCLPIKAIFGKPWNLEERLLGVPLPAPGWKQQTAGRYEDETCTGD